MLLSEYLIKSEFSKQTEIRRTLLIAFYNLRVNEFHTFTLVNVTDWLEELGYARPNLGRLRSNLKRSKMFVTAGGNDSFRIHAATIETLDTEYPNLAKKTENVISHDSIIPESLLQKDRAFILMLIKQINSSYENNIFDGCAVLMRRLMEILLILSYQESKIEANIQDSNGEFKQLNFIIDDAKKNQTLKLSRNTKEHLETFRKLGNFSAHKIYYNANRKDISAIILDYKAIIEELLYKSGLRT
jgi:hypothetical protein